MSAGRFRLGFLFCLIAAVLGASAKSQPAVWTVRTANTSLVIFGSIHLLPPGLDWEPQALTDALARANEVWFELPINAATDGAAESLSLQQGILPKGDSLYNHLSARDAARLNDACARLQLPSRFVAPMRPWLAEVTISLAQDAQSGAVPSQGVEQKVWDQVSPAVRRKAFETPRQQIGFLAGAPMADQIASLDQTLDEVASDPDLYRRVVTAWLAGDIRGLAKDALEPLAQTSPTLYRRLISDRNRRWAATLAGRLKAGGVIVVIVGTGHLLGPEGVPALLRSRGFTVDGPFVEGPGAH
jgi:uncharacterized protein YbaP (TraB family)